MNKRGQFYLISALVIISLIIGVAAVSNYAKKKETVRIYNLKEELGIEGGEIIEHGVYQTKDIPPLFEEFTKKYAKYAGEGKNLYFAYGDEEQIHVQKFEEAPKGQVSIQTGNTQQGIPITTVVSEVETINNPGTEISIVLPNGKTRDFNLRPGQNFIFVIAQEVEGETYIESS